MAQRTRTAAHLWTDRLDGELQRIVRCPADCKLVTCTGYRLDAHNGAAWIYRTHVPQVILRRLQELTDELRRVEEWSGRSVAAIEANP